MPEPDRKAAGSAIRTGGQRAVVEAARELRAAGRPFALAVVIENEGSTYRKPGALALVTGDGRRVGVISGGCLESGLVALAGSALEARAPREAVFDTRSDDDLVFGSGTGCRGRMRVLAVPALPEQPCPVVERLIAAQDARRSCTLEIADIAPGLADCGAVEVRPPPLVLLLGAGPEAPPLLAVARTLGWFVWIADHRDGLLGAEWVQDADRVLPGRPAEVLARVAGDLPEAAIAMTHLAGLDLDALAALATLAVPYVGLLGPPARRDELLARLTDRQRVALDGRLRAPVGLPLGGEGPEAIALAIAADLLRAFNAARRRVS